MQGEHERHGRIGLALQAKRESGNALFDRQRLARNKQARDERSRVGSA
jgi:hypothetical protein